MDIEIKSPIHLKYIKKRTISKVIFLTIKFAKFEQSISFLKYLRVNDFDLFVEVVNYIQFKQINLNKFKAHFDKKNLNKYSIIYRYLFSNDTYQDKQLFVHVGNSKTGTSAIQIALSENQESLTNMGFIYPALGDFKPPAHFDLYFYLKNQKSRLTEKKSKLTDDVIAATAEFNSKVILSCEHFTKLNSNELNKLFNYFNKFNITVILSIRNWADSILSHWNESSKHGQYFSISEYYALITSDGLPPDSINSVRYDLFSVLLKLEKVIPRANLKIIIYDNVTKSNIDIRNYFFSEILNFENEFDFGKKQNIKYSSLNIDIIRCLNFIHKVRYNKHVKAVRRNYDRLFINENSSVASETFLSKRNQLASDFVIDGSISFFRKIENKILGRFSNQIINLSGNRLFPDEMKNIVKDLDVKEFMNIEEINVEMNKLYDLVMN